ncbi:hypothetical protein FRX31_020312 [Thalictrum thalictroides]|uniref:Uncharacterized protein n=1 Tax=Thalictrum thalictroides TaxID=46969 RepID=A0A7J6VZ12_THATH|nr:hypothetical protein FRX31_020312 [Thalictrum thalictroides]
MAARNLNPEKRYTNMFNTNSGHWFKAELEARGWTPLFQNANSKFSPALVTHFYNHFNLEDFIPNERITVKWGANEVPIVVTPNLIGEILGIQAKDQTPQMQNPFSTIEPYITQIGTNTKINKRGGIKMSSLRRNQYLMCRFINDNICGSSCSGEIYREGVHVLYMIQCRNLDFCICRTLLNTIGKVLKHPRNATKIVQVTNPVEFGQVQDFQILEIERPTVGYNNCDKEFWYPGLMIEDAREDSPLPPDENDTRFIEPIANPAIRDVLGTFWKTICKGVKEQAESSARIEENLIS